MKKKVKLLIGTILVFVVSIILIDCQKIHYSIDGNKSLTVWKRIGGKCYVFPYNYSGMFIPNDNYVITDSKLESMDIIFDSISSTILVSGRNFDIVTNKSGINKITSYNDDKNRNDKLFTYKDGNYYKYKSDVEFITLYIKENYAKNKVGDVIKPI